jgi:hypothetical protein
MRSTLVSSNIFMKSFTLLALLLGAVACTPEASNAEVGAAGNLTPGHRSRVAAFGESCQIPYYCQAGLSCITDTHGPSICGCPLGGPLSGSTCVLPVVLGNVPLLGKELTQFNVALMKQDPPGPINADGAPVESFSVVEDNQSNLFGEFAFFSSLEDGVYLVSAGLPTGERGQSERLTLGELTSGKLTVTVK